MKNNEKLEEKIIGILNKHHCDIKHEYINGNDHFKCFQELQQFISEQIEKARKDERAKLIDKLEALPLSEICKSDIDSIIKEIELGE